MINKILIATHGRFAEGIYESMTMITGEQLHVDYISMYIDDAIDYPNVIKGIVEKHDYTKENLIVLTDIIGGSVNSEFFKYMKCHPFHLITGLNLPLLLELVLAQTDTIEELLQNVTKNTKEQIIYCNKLLNQTIDCEDGIF